jgi:hypothetical protein
MAMNSKIYSSFSMDFTFEIHHARRADGQWFSRHHEKAGGYGWRWTAWRKSSEPDFTRSRLTQNTARLPIEGAAPRAKRGPRCCGLSCRKSATARASFTIQGTHIRTKPHCGDAACLQGYADLCGAKPGEMVLEPLSA